MKHLKESLKKYFDRYLQVYACYVASGMHFNIDILSLFPLLTIPVVNIQYAIPPDIPAAKFRPAGPKIATVPASCIRNRGHHIPEK